MKVSPTKALAIAATSLAVLAGAAAADSQPEPIWGGLENITRFDDASYFNTNVSLRNFIGQTISEQYGLPDIAATYPLTEDGASIVVYYDANDAQIDGSLDDMDIPLPASQFSFVDQDTRAGALAAVVLEDPDSGFAYIIGGGVIPQEELDSGADRGNIENYSFFATDFMTNNNGAPTYVVPSANVSDDARAQNGITKSGQIDIAGTGDLEVSVISVGATRHFVQVADPNVTMMLGRLDVAPSEGELVSSLQTEGSAQFASADTAEANRIELVSN